MDLTGGLGLRADRYQGAARRGDGRRAGRGGRTAVGRRLPTAAKTAASGAEHQGAAERRTCRSRRRSTWPTGRTSPHEPEDEIVIVSVGELGPWGSGRTRFEAELGIHSDGEVDLSAGAVLELAWNMGLLTWNDSPKPGWYDTDGNLVPEEDIAERYHDEVVARSGVRPFDEGMGNDYKDGTDEEEAEVFLDHDVTFSVPTREIAEEYVKLDEAHTSFAADAESGEWNVTRHAGSMIRVPRRAAMTRTVGGQFPKGFDPVKWGIPASMVGDVDKIALWNIVTTVDAYLSAGFTPVEILQADPPVHGRLHPGHRLRRHGLHEEAVPRPLPQP